MRINDFLNDIRALELIGNKDQVITNVVALDEENISNKNLLWVSEKYIEKISSIKCGSIIVPKSASNLDLNKECNYIFVENPRWSFMKFLELFYAEDFKSQVSNSAKISPSAKLSENVNIGHNVVIEDGVVIGNNVSIDSNTVIKKNVVIKNNVQIGANCTIGNDGFGYEKDMQGNYQKIIHISSVIINDNVEIGNNTCIDRGVLKDTVIGENVKIDNLVHIAHGVKINRNSMIIANAMIAGSVEIGENVWVAPSTSIINGKTIGNDSVIGLGAVVLKNVSDKEVIIGNPGKPLPSKK